MLVFGTKAKTLATELKPNLFCPHCGTQGKIRISIVAKYFHLTLIPTVPTGKVAISQCEHCKQVLEEHQMPAAFRAEVNALKQNHKTPKWMFAGLVLFGALVVFSGISSRNNSIENEAFINAPVVGDKYHVEVGSLEYTAFRVNNVTDDSVYFDLNQYTINKRTGIYRIDKEENYVPGGQMSKTDLKKMFDENKIYDVVRESK
jgi:hypothetical protein